MALKAMVKTLDGVDAAHKALYRKDGEGDKAVYLLDVEPVEGFVLENVTGLKTALEKERTTKGELETKLADFKDLDPAKAREALTKVDAMKNWSSDDKVKEQVDQHGKKVAAEKDAEIGALKAQLQKLTGGYAAVTIDNALTDAATEAKFIAPKIAAKLFRDSVKLGEDLKPQIVDAAGKPVTVTNNDGTSRAMTIKEFVESQAKLPEFAPLIAGAGATGTKGPGPADSRTNPTQGQQQTTPLHLQRQQIDTQLGEEIAKVYR